MRREWTVPGAPRGASRSVIQRDLESTGEILREAAHGLSAYTLGARVTSGAAGGDVRGLGPEVLSGVRLCPRHGGPGPPDHG